MSSRFDCAIPLGQTCNVSFLLQNCKLKKKTTAFEWFVSQSLNDITNALLQMAKGTDGDILKNCGGETQIINANISSCHYSNFNDIYIRRRDRLLECIKNNSKVLFIRFEHTNHIYSYEDIDNFMNAIKAINPNCDDMKLLLIKETEMHLDHPFLINELWDPHSAPLDHYCSSSQNIEFFLRVLEKHGYNVHDKTDVDFNDMSIS